MTVSKEKRQVTEDVTLSHFLTPSSHFKNNKYGNETMNEKTG